MENPEHTVITLYFPGADALTITVLHHDPNKIDLLDGILYNYIMPKSLIETNPYLKDPVKRKDLFITTVSSSTAIEGVHAAVKQAIEESRKQIKSIIVSESEESGGSRR